MLKPQDIELLKKHVIKFRNAVQQSEALRQDTVFANFPQGCCFDASILLGSYLQAVGFGDFECVSAEKRRGPWGTHAWLEQGSLLIDITADQFKDIKETVIIGPATFWEARFRCNGRHYAHYDFYKASDLYTYGHLARLYQMVFKEID